MVSYKFYTADVFTHKIFGGNQLAVFPDANGISSELMQKIAKEFNLSETVFVLPPQDSNNTRRLRTLLQVQNYLLRVILPSVRLMCWLPLAKYP